MIKWTITFGEKFDLTFLAAVSLRSSSDSSSSVRKVGFLLNQSGKFEVGKRGDAECKSLPPFLTKCCYIF